MSEDAIWIITADDSPVTGEGDSKSITYRNPWDTGKGITEVATRGVKVSAEKLETELSRFLQLIGKVFQHVEQQVNEQTGFKLDEVELCVEITGEGEIKLLGTGINTSTKGGITLKFKRDEKNTPAAD